MPSYQITLTQPKRIAGRFIAYVRRELQKALAEENAARGTTQASIASALGVNRSVIHRQINGTENLTLGTIAEIATALGRQPIFILAKPVTVAGTNHYFQIAASAQDVVQNVQTTTTAAAALNYTAIPQAFSAVKNAA